MALLKYTIFDRGLCVPLSVKFPIVAVARPQAPDLISKYNTRSPLIDTCH